MWGWGGGGVYVCVCVWGGGGMCVWGGGRGSPLLPVFVKDGSHNVLTKYFTTP